MTEDSAEPELVVEASRELDAPPTVAWRSWTDAAILRRWWGPKGFTCPTAEMDVRVGATSLVSMSAPDQGFPEMFSTWEYTRVEEPHRLEFVFRFTDADGTPLGETGRPPGVPAEVAHTVTFDALPGGRTRMSVREDGYTSPEPLEMSRQGLEQSLDKLTPLFAGGAAVD
ncbi:MAG: SRPBCC domain-containing protein [Microbacterium sp.]